MSPPMSGLSATNPYLLSPASSPPRDAPTAPSPPQAATPLSERCISPDSFLSDDAVSYIDDHRIGSEVPGHIVSTGKLSKPHLESLITSTHISSHLAVLLPKDLWKPDAEATTCDTLTCDSKFGLFGPRRHHCRKCGGVFCSGCTMHSVPLLDTTNMPFIFPPPDSPLISSPRSPVSSVPSLSSSASSAAESIPPIEIHRICDACYVQLRTGRSPRVSFSSSSASSLRHSSPEPSPLSSPAPSRASSLRYQVGGRALRQHASVSNIQARAADPTNPRGNAGTPNIHGPRPSFRRSHSSSSHEGLMSTQAIPRRTSKLSVTDSTTVIYIPPAPASTGAEMLHNALHTSVDRSRATHQTSSTSSTRAREAIEAERSLTGEIQAYPLKVSSAGCKARGGGVWTPKPIPVDVRALFAPESEKRAMQGIYTRKAAGRVDSMDFVGAEMRDVSVEEDEDEEVEREKKRMWRSRLIKDGDIQVRVPLAPNPSAPVVRGHPLEWSTF